MQIAEICVECRNSKRSRAKAPMIATTLLDPNSNVFPPTMRLKPLLVYILLDTNENVESLRGEITDQG
jgi:hypothetical protein